PCSSARAACRWELTSALRSGIGPPSAGGCHYRGTAPAAPLRCGGLVHGEQGHLAVRASAPAPAAPPTRSTPPWGWTWSPAASPGPPTRAGRRTSPWRWAERSGAGEQGHGRVGPFPT